MVSMNNSAGALSSIVVLVLIIISAVSYPASASIVIQQVLYDPLGTESGGESVEIQNTGLLPVDISQWTLSTEGSVADARIPNGTVLGPSQFYLIADLGWSTLKDDPQWPNASHEEAISLYNADSGIAIRMSNGSVVDAVGWGDPTQIPVELFEGTPATSVSPGMALLRIEDSNNNSQDFIETVPFAGGGCLGNCSGGSVIELTVTVDPSQNLSIDSILISPDDDPVSPGIQIFPSPGSNKSVSVNVVITARNISQVNKVNATLQETGEYTILNRMQDLSPTQSIFSGNLSVAFFQDPGNYSAIIRVSDSISSIEAEFNFFYEELIGLSVDSANLSLGTRSPYDTVTVVGDDDLATNDRATLQNIGNARIDIEIGGTNLTSGGESIGVSNVSYSFGGGFSSLLSGQLGFIPELVDLNMGYGLSEVNELSLRMFIPGRTRSGVYRGSIFLNAVRG